MCNTVSYYDEDCAKRNGVVLIRLKSPNMCGGNKCAAICYFSGKVIRCDGELWVRDELKKMGIKIIKKI